MELSPINKVSDAEALQSLKQCCGAGRWVDKMMSARPFTSAAELIEKCDQFLGELTDDDWKEAFTQHPKIGDIEVLRKKFHVASAWESGEQSGVATATDTVLEELAQGNVDYEKKFGYIFIVCATGKSAEEMLGILQSRLPNDHAAEMKIAAGEQSKITRLRLEKLCQ